MCRKAQRQFGVAFLGPEIQVDHTNWVACTYVHLADNSRLKARKVDGWGAHDDDGFSRIEIQVHSPVKASGPPYPNTYSTIELVQPVRIPRARPPGANCSVWRSELISAYASSAQHGDGQLTAHACHLCTHSMDVDPASFGVVCRSRHARLYLVTYKKAIFGRWENGKTPASLGSGDLEDLPTVSFRIQDGLPGTKAFSRHHCWWWSGRSDGSPRSSEGQHRPCRTGKRGHCAAERSEHRYLPAWIENPQAD